MKLAIFCNYLNHHQVMLADELYKKLGGEFLFVTTLPVDEGHLKGSADYSSIREYCIKAYLDLENHKHALELARQVDVALFIGDALEFEVERAKVGKLSFEVSERWLKKGIINLLSPRLIRWQWHYHTKFNKLPFYKLCSSAFSASDDYKMFSYRGRCYKWGYFVENGINAIDKIISSKENNGITTLLWCSRFIDWKHPELPIHLSIRLKEAGFKFRLDMIGDGVLLQRTKDMVVKYDLSNEVNILGSVPNNEVTARMRDHDIFLFTSDRCEGWGAVANEAMNNGCNVIASDEIGCVPFLINDGVNGMVFKTCNVESLFEKVSYSIIHPETRKEMIVNAYNDIQNIWSPQNAAHSLLILIKDLMVGRETSINEGPGSKAPILKY